MGRSAEAWQELEEANEAQRQYEEEMAWREYQAQQFSDGLFNMMVGINRAKAEELRHE